MELFKCELCKEEWQIFSRREEAAEPTRVKAKILSPDEKNREQQRQQYEIEVINASERNLRFYNNEGDVRTHDLGEPYCVECNTKIEKAEEKGKAKARSEAIAALTKTK